jgi:hypothetical protein
VDSTGWRSSGHRRFGNCWLFVEITGVIDNLLTAREMADSERGMGRLCCNVVFDGNITRDAVACEKLVCLSLGLTSPKSSVNPSLDFSSG